MTAEILGLLAQFAFLLLAFNALFLVPRGCWFDLGLFLFLVVAAAAFVLSETVVKVVAALLVALSGPLLAGKCRWLAALPVSCGAAGLVFGISLLETEVSRSPEERAFRKKWDLSRAERARLVREFPLESLKDRLAFESRPREFSTKLALAGAAPEVVEAFYKRLAYLEGGSGRDSVRNASLEILHTNAVDRFVNQPGFGNKRMQRDPDPSYLKPYDEKPVPLVGGVRIRLDPKDFATQDETYPIGPTPLLSSFWSMHRAGVRFFVDSSDLGYVRSREQVAGFQRHQFRGVPGSWNDQKGQETWLLERLELISLLRHERPVVYLSDRLPSMTGVEKLKTRPVGEFEEKALKAFQQGEDLAHLRQGDKLSVVGSIRAGGACLQCHEGGRGDLLGAFTYALKREPLAER